MSPAPTLPPLSDDALREIESGWYPTRLDMLRAVREAATAHASALAQRVEALERDLAAMTTARDVAVEIGATYAARADELRADAERYRKLRAMHWSASPCAVVLHPKEAVKLGYDCPSLARLDELLDAIEDEVKHG